MFIESAFTVTLALFMGAFPTAYLLGRRQKAVDMRAKGYQNPGAFNAYRRWVKGLAYWCW